MFFACLPHCLPRRGLAARYWQAKNNVQGRDCSITARGLESPGSPPGDGLSEPGSPPHRMAPATPFLWSPCRRRDGINAEATDRPRPCRGRMLAACQTCGHGNNQRDDRRRWRRLCQAVGGEAEPEIKVQGGPGSRHAEVVDSGLPGSCPALHTCSAVCRAVPGRGSVAPR